MYHDELDLTDWLTERVATLTGADPATVQLDMSFADLGLTSLQAVELTGDLENYLDRSLDPTLAYQYPTVTTMVSHLTGRTR